MACLLGSLVATNLTPPAWRLATGLAAGVVVVACLVLLFRAIRRDRGFIALEGYEWHRQTPDHVRDPEAVEGVVLPEKRLPR